MFHHLAPLALLSALLTALLALPAVGESPPVPGTEVEVQGRGPIHEAFAQPTSSTPQPGPVVPRQPPPPIPEQPPDQKPEGDSVAWIPGYWSWDDDRGDFLWVSGVWRVIPPGRKWVPGYWTSAEGDWQWVSGFWASTEQAEVPYVEPPPATLERGPALPPPSDDCTYVPGCWIWRERYLWRPGFWCPNRPGFVYCPPRFCWTPRGCRFVDGFWDYSLERRGILFAPVCFHRPLWNTPGWVYRPSHIVPCSSLLGSLWVRPRYSSYAFGDFYAARYRDLGYRSWIHYGALTRDPLLGYYRWANRSNPGWQRELLHAHDLRVRGALARPPRTLAGGTHPLVQPLSHFRSDHFRLVPGGANRGPVTADFHRGNGERWVMEINGVRHVVESNRLPGPISSRAGHLAGPSHPLPPHDVRLPAHEARSMPFASGPPVRSIRSAPAPAVRHPSAPARFASPPRSAIPIRPAPRPPARPHVAPARPATPRPAPHGGHHH
jgi:hypothetical protein